MIGARVTGVQIPYPLLRLGFVNEIVRQITNAA